MGYVARNNAKVKEWVKDHQILIIRIIILFMFFIVPFSSFIPLSGFQPAKLKISAYPPGYPVEGQTWTVEVWISQENWLTWKTVPNATVTMHTSLQGDFIKTTNDEGKAIFIYTATLGSVSFETDFDKLATVWTPQQKFVSNAIALLFIGIFGIGSTSFFWQTVSVCLKNDRHDFIGRLLSWVLIILTTFGFILCLVWLNTWKLGTEWGFGNQIVSLDGLSITFDPHLIVITAGAIIAAFLVWIKVLLGKGKSRKKVPDYIE